MEKIKKFINSIPEPLKNKYFITLVLFLIWSVFLDDYNLINQKKLKNKVDELSKQREFYISEIQKDSTKLQNLKNNPQEQEKFAREKFLMKKDNEDIFIIRKHKDE